MLSKFYTKKIRGFTLVELLIVVAIIGVLSTIGVPTFRRMIQKSRKSEAKVNLGAIFTAQSAFQAEYSSYGNNLGRMGFEIDGAAATLTYVIGFPAAQGACAGIADFTGASAVPDPVSVLGSAINISFPSYYTNGTQSYSVSGFNAGNFCQVTSVPETGNVAVGSAQDTFDATAQGVVAPGLEQNVLANLDIWMMDEGRVLRNTADGVK